MIRFDEDSRILWIEADSPDSAWDVFHANSIPIGGPIRGIAFYDPLTESSPTGMISRRDSIDAFFSKEKNIGRIETKEEQTKCLIHILPYSVDVSKYQFLLDTPLRMWKFLVPPGESVENCAVRHCHDDIVQSGLTEDDTLIGVTRSEDTQGEHYYFLLTIGEQCKSTQTTVWVEREKFGDWKWDPYVETLTNEENVIEITRKKGIYAKVVEKMMG